MHTWAVSDFALTSNVAKRNISVQTNFGGEYLVFKFLGMGLLDQRLGAF